VPQAAFEGLQAQLAANRSEFYRAVPSGPFTINNDLLAFIQS
jgi:non-heme chloroperoxidase